MSDVASRLTAALADRYRIERELGEGGMATVYLAHDLKHERDVALKVLKPELAAMIGAERFVAEIKTTANLQHPHILPLFDSGEADGFLFYVMPYIQGESLRDRLDREGQIGVDEAIRLTKDVADALDYAHRQGVIHRDIKPANILLQDDRPIVADFGIAVAISAAGGGRMTETGLSLGTPHYMSPEQATAERDLSGRSDVYSLACVLYEMLAGDPPHTGPNAQAVLIRILTEAPRAVTQIRSSVPPHVSAVLDKALEKLPADRFESARAFSQALENEGFTYRVRRRTETVEGMAPVLAVSPARPLWWRALPWGIAALALVVAVWSSSGAGASRKAGVVARLDLDLGGLELERSAEDVAISPDGTMLALSGTRDGVQGVYLRDMDGADWRLVAGTEGGARPGFSPDNLYLLFRDTDAGTLVRVSVEGGSALTMANIDADPFNSHWGPDGSIVLNSPQGSFVIPADGTDPIGPLPGVGGRRSSLLPDGSGVVVGNGQGVVVHTFALDSTRVLIPDASHPTYVEPGYLLYVASSGGLFAQPFDLATHTLTGPPTRILDRVGASIARRGYSVSDDGTLVYLDAPPGTGGGAMAESTRFVEATLDGAVDTVRIPTANLQSPRYSPEGRRIVYEVIDESARSLINIFDLVTGTVTPLTFTDDNEDPIWSPDGTRIVFDLDGEAEAAGGSVEDLHIKWADNRAPAERLLTLAGEQNALQWLDDGRVLFESDHAGNWDLYLIDAGGSAEPEPFLQAPWAEFEGQLSPRGDLMTYVSSETSNAAVWLRSFPEPSGQWRVSTGEGRFPRWAPDGSGVYYWVSGSLDTLKFAAVEGEPVVRVGAPETVLTFPQAGRAHWDVHPDGDRFLFRIGLDSTEGAEDEPGRYLVVLNWFEELRARVEERNR